VRPAARRSERPANDGRKRARRPRSRTASFRHGNPDMTDVFLVSAMRTAIGTFGGALKDIPPAELGVATAKAAIAQAGIPVDAIGHAVYGQVLPSEPADAYLARVIA